MWIIQSYIFKHIYVYIYIYIYIALSWFISYLFDRSSSVQIYNSFSSPSPMKYGVPHGSVLGPSLFSIYLYPLPSITSKYPNIHYHLYADDIQLYMFLPTNSSLGLNNQLSNCANDIKEWLISNNLLLNTSKTTLLNLSPSPTYFPPFLIDNIVISPSPTASNFVTKVYFLILHFPSFLIL